MSPVREMERSSVAVGGVIFLVLGALAVTGVMVAPAVFSSDAAPKTPDRADDELPREEWDVTPGSEEPTGNDTESVDDERSLEDIFDQVETDDDGESDNPFDEGADEEPAFEENETAVDEGPGFDEEDEFEGGEEDAADEGPGFGDDDEFGDNDETDDEGIGDDNEEAEGGDSGPDDGSENTTQDDSDPSETNVSGGGAEAPNESNGSNPGDSGDDEFEFPFNLTA